MHKSILIHNQNTPLNLQEKFDKENIIEFDYSNSDYKDIDEYISNITIKYIKNKKIDLIYVKDNLSSNYLELYGLRVAYHIRLTPELKFIPIIILSDLDGCTLSRLELKISRIIFTKNIFIEMNNVKSIEKYQNKIFSKFNEKDYKNNFLDLIQVDSPENSTNHSITNEWAIFQWAKELGVTDSQSVNNTLSNISHQLYFKYLYQKNELYSDISLPNQKSTNTHSGGNIKIKKKAQSIEKNVLMIDNDLDKGWEDIFQKYFSKKRNYVFRTINPVEIKNKCYEDIEKIVTREIESIQIPDLILLDMGLTESDSYEENPKKISGIRLLKKIKSFNPAIQVIMFSATTRSDILEQASKYKILGYIKKDSIDYSIYTTKANIEKLSNFLKDGEEKFYLKDIWNIQKEILNSNFLKHGQFKKIPEMRNTIEVTFEVLNSNINKPLKFIMFNIFKCIEYINEYYIKEDKSDIARWIDNGEEIKTFFKKNDPNNNFPLERENDKFNNSAENKIRIIMHEKLKINDYNENMLIRKLVCNRNYHMHTGDVKRHCKEYIEIEIETNSILEWFRLLEKIITSIDKQNKSI